MKELKAVVPGEYIKHLRWKARFGKDLDGMRSGTRYRKHGCQLTSLLESCDNATSLDDIAKAIEHYDKCVEQLPLTHTLLSHNYNRCRIAYIAALQLPVLAFLTANSNLDLITDSLAIASSVALIGIAVVSYNYVVGKIINPYKTLHQDLFSHIFNRISLATQSISVPSNNSDMSKLLRPFKWYEQFNSERKGHHGYTATVIGSGDITSSSKILIGVIGYKQEKNTKHLSELAVITGIKSADFTMTGTELGNRTYLVESAEPINEKLDLELAKFNCIYPNGYVEVRNGAMLLALNINSQCHTTILSDFEKRSVDYSMIDLLQTENRNTVFIDMVKAIINAL